VVIFEGLEQTLLYVYLFCHIPIFYPRRPLNKRYLALHWAKGASECIAPEFGTVLVNRSNSDYARDIHDRRSITSHIHLLNGVAVAWKCKKQTISNLNSTGLDITSLISRVKETLHLCDFVSSLVYPIGTGIPRLKEIQGTICAIKYSRIHENTRHKATKITWLNELYAAGIIALLYTKTPLQLAYINTKPLCGKHLQAMISFLVGVRYYPPPDMKHYQSPDLDCFQMLKYYLRHGQPILVSTLPSTSA
jgi:hypothetical protein